MSGRWGQRPLGRGMEGTVIRSQFGFSGRSAALASSRTTHRSRQVTTVVLLQETETTPDYLPSLSSREFTVDSSPGSFFPVLSVPADDPLLVRKYFRLDPFHDHPLYFFYARFVALVKRPLLDPLGPY